MYVRVSMPHCSVRSHRGRMRDQLLGVSPSHLREERADARMTRGDREETRGDIVLCYPCKCGARVLMMIVVHADRDYTCMHIIVNKYTKKGGEAVGWAFSN